MATNTLAVQDQDAIAIERCLINGDLSGLKPEQRIVYYNRTCESLGLNPLTKPFEYILLNGKLTLYAKRDCAEQLRKIHGVSVLEKQTERIEDVYVVYVKVCDKHGRTDFATGAVNLNYPAKYRNSQGQYVAHPKAGQLMTGDDLANVLMKAETKAKRRATLSICGLGVTDVSELETIPRENLAAVDEEGKPTVACENCFAPIVGGDLEGHYLTLGKVMAKSENEFDGAHLCLKCIVMMRQLRAEQKQLAPVNVTRDESLLIHDHDAAVVPTAEQVFGKRIPVGER